MSPWRLREIANETRFRSANEAIESACDTAGHQALETYICECSDAACTAPIMLSRDEYEKVRGFATHFAIALDHENPEIDALLIEYERYATVAKLPGVPARFAQDTDPRRREVAPA